MSSPFWEAMVRWGGDAYTMAEAFGHDSFEKGPVWCFDRIGMSVNLFRNHWTVCIGGEHEDGYDPDFLIYNDVVVWTPNGEVSIYGYPKDVFPATDFHTATLVGDEIVVIGGLGYAEEREFWRTPIYVLELERMSMRAVEGKDDEPGWIFKHDARLIDATRIEVSGGKRLDENGGIVRNDGVHELDLLSMVWTRR